MTPLSEQGAGTFTFVDSPERMLAEARRVLKPGGRLVIGFIDRDSAMGQDYLAHQAENVFYREATFYSAADWERLLLEAGFAIDAWGQTLAHALRETRDIEAMRPGLVRGGRGKPSKKTCSDRTAARCGERCPTCPAVQCRDS